MADVAKVIEITCSSPKSFQDAIENGLARIEKTVNNVTGAWVKEEKVEVRGKTLIWRVTMKVTFVVGD